MIVPSGGVLTMATVSSLTRLLEGLELRDSIDIRKGGFLIVERDLHDVKCCVPFVDLPLAAFKERMKVRGETGFDEAKNRMRLIECFCHGKVRIFLLHRRRHPCDQIKRQER